MSATKKVRSSKDLEISKPSFRFQQEVFQLSKSCPEDERYSLTDQIRRSSRFIGANLAEAWSKRRHAAHPLSKLTDRDGELQESLHWLRSAFCCGHVTEEKSTKRADQAGEIGRMFSGMIER